MSGPHNQRLHIFTVFLRKTVFFIPNNYNYFARSAFLAILCLAEIYVFTRPNDVSFRPQFFDKCSNWATDVLVWQKKRWTQWSCFSCFMLFQTQKLCVDLPGTQNVYPLYPSCWSIPPPVAPDIGSRRARPESVIIWTDRQQALRELFETFWVWKPALFVRVASQSCLEPLSESFRTCWHQHTSAFKLGS